MSVLVVITQSMGAVGESQEKSADVAVGAWRLRCITMYFYIVMVCNKKSILTMAYRK